MYLLSLSKKNRVADNICVNINLVTYIKCGNNIMWRKIYEDFRIKFKCKLCKMMYLNSSGVHMKVQYKCNVMYEYQ